RPVQKRTVKQGPANVQEEAPVFASQGLRSAWRLLHFQGKKALRCPHGCHTNPSFPRQAAQRRWPPAGLTTAIPLRPVLKTTVSPPDDNCEISAMPVANAPMFGNQFDSRGQ